MNIIIIIDRCLTIYITMKIIHQQLTIVKTLPGKPQLVQLGGSFQNFQVVPATYNLSKIWKV